MSDNKKIVFAPHDDGSGAFMVLCRLARALVHLAEAKGYGLHMYFLNSSMADQDGQVLLNRLVAGMKNDHQAVFVPTDNLIWIPKDEQMAEVIGSQIPDVLKKWVRPLWHSWPCHPNWIRPNLPIMKREGWMRRDSNDGTDLTKPTWAQKGLSHWRTTVQDLTPNWWQDVALGISMGVPQLHRVARRERFPSVEVGDWFFSVGLRGCMLESFVPSEIIAATEPDLRMIEEDEYKACEVWLTLHQAPRQPYKAHLANSPVRLREMTGLLWTGDPRPDDVRNWDLAIKLREAIDHDISQIRATKAHRVAYIVPGTTPVWKGVVNTLKARAIQKGDTVAVLVLDRGKGMIRLLEDGGMNLNSTKDVLKNVLGEEMHLATCRASDFGVTRTAGGVLGFAETQRPSVLLDEPGHWLGRIQRDQCREPGLCVVIPVAEFLGDPAGTIQKEADKLGTNSDLDHIVEAAVKLEVGAERALAEYLFGIYIE